MTQIEFRIDAGSAAEQLKAQHYATAKDSFFFSLSLSLALSTLETSLIAWQHALRELGQVIKSSSGNEGFPSRFPFPNYLPSELMNPIQRSLMSNRLD